MSRGSTPRHTQTAGDLGLAVQFNAETPWHFRGRIKRWGQANPQDWQVKETAIPE